MSKCAISGFICGLIAVGLAAPFNVFAASGGASVAARTVRITGGGFTPGEDVVVVLEPVPDVPDVPVGVGTADAKGNVDLNLSRVTSLGAAAATAKNLGLRGRTSGAFTTFSPGTDPKPSIWTIIRQLLSQNEPSVPETSHISDVELASAGFNLGSISISDISQNVSLSFQQSLFDVNTDTITSSVAVQPLSAGQVFATYSVSGTFQHLSDPSNLKDILPPMPDSFQFTEQIGDVQVGNGQVVSEPPSVAVLSTGLAAILFACCRRPHRGSTE